MRAVGAILFSAVMSFQALAAERFAELPLDQMTPEQRMVADTILAGPRGSLAGPFNAWLRSPALADRLQDVGEHVRFNSSLPARLKELAILVTAREWTAQYEWYAHAPLAQAGGLDPAIIAAIAAGKTPASMKPDERLVYELSLKLHRDKAHISDADFKAARDMLGEQGLVDLIATNGYYGLVSMTLNVAEVGLPPGVPLPLK